MISFSEFAKALHRFLPDLNQGDYVKALLDHIVVFEDEDMNPVHTQKLDTLKRYYSGTSFATFAKRSRDHLDPEVFASFVADFDPELQEEVRQALSGYLSDSQLQKFPESCADLFVRVIKAEADGTVGSEGHDNEATQAAMLMPYQMQTMEDRLKDECNRRCLLCGEKRTSHVLTEIVPSSSDYKVRNDVRGLLEERMLKDDIPDFNNDYDTHGERNYALLDPNCYSEYTNNFSAEKCSGLMSNKIYAIRQAEIQEELDSLEVDRSLSELLDSLDRLIDPEAVAALQYSPTSISNKIEPERHILKAQVSELVARYYGFIKNELHAREGLNGFQFIDLQYSMKKYFLTLQRAGEDQDEIYSRLALWVKDSTRCKSIVACEILVAFFIQDCEVFNEIA